MKLMQRLTAIFITLIFVVVHTPTAGAFDRKEHDKYMQDVLFKYFKNIEIESSTSEAKKAFEALKTASYLSIDQFNHNGEKELTELSSYGVKNLPSFNDIDYTAGSNHRHSTHRGWDAEIKAVYSTIDAERWKIRKSILLNTANKIFDFNGNKSKQESFCALIYYIHILGDRISDEKYSPNSSIMDVGGRPDEYDIIHQLKYHFSILFSDQAHSYKYLHVQNKLEIINDNISNILKRSKDNPTGKDYEKYRKCAEQVMELLICNIPEMLKEEDFFRNVFYNK